MPGNTRQVGRMFWCKRQPGHERSKHNMSKIASHIPMAKLAAIIHVLHTIGTLSIEFSSLVSIVSDKLQQKYRHPLPAVYTVQVQLFGKINSANR